MRTVTRHTFSIFCCALPWCLIACVGDGFVLGRNMEEELPKCGICAFPGSTIRNDFVPSLTRAATRVTLGSTDGNPLGGIEDVDMTCTEWNDYSMENQLLNSDSADCLDLREWLSWQCCEGMPSLYECETKLEKMLISDSADYGRNKVPITDGTALDVRISVQVTDIAIVNYGVDGGAVEVSGFLRLEWTDDRLKWNSSEAGCSSISVSSSKIWVPHFERDNDEDDDTIDTYEISKFDILADGRISGSRRLRMLAKCKAAPERLSKVCSANFLDSEDMGRVHYVADPMKYDDDVSIPGYELDRNKTAIFMNTTLVPYNVEQNVVLQFYFRPLIEKCGICDGIGELYNGTTSRRNAQWNNLFPDTEDLNCFEVNDLLVKYSVHSRKCLIGRLSFTESCCDNTMSSYECESNVHNQISERENTITPPDPSANENLDSLRRDSFESSDKVDVSVSLDVIQMIEIDMKSNTLKMLVSLELSWFDQRLEWEPFIGSCYRVSCRASIDADLTEIWVPNIEMANMIEGVQSLPEAHASVYYNGLVIWRRTGVLTGTCELKGVRSFPFDTISCYFDFGEDRDPRFHRVNYFNSREVQFYASLQDSNWNYQEYRLIPDDTEVKFRTEDLSGFENRLIRYRFYFERASNFYIHMFVVTYLLFTCLSFGMFFIDLSCGERLGYGTSILFVIVAQDITLADSAPVTQEFLWIYQLSLGSKILVIFGVVETLIVQWVLNKYFEDSKQNASIQKEEHVEEREATNASNISSNAISDINDGQHNDEDSYDENCGDLVGGGHEEKKTILHNLTNVPVVAIKMVGKAYCMIGKKLTSLKVYSDDSEKTKIEKKLKIVDISSAVIGFLAYFLFVIILGLTST